MNCQEVVERMHRYLDRDLTSDETAQMYQHIAVCPECAETFNILKSLNRELEDLPAVTPPVSLVDAIMPKLDAIDRDRESLVAPPAVKSQEPAEMMPDIRRPRRAGSWWSTVGGRTAIGCRRCTYSRRRHFNYEPKMLSDAEIPYEEASTTSAGANEDSAETEIQDMVQPFAADGGAETGGTANEGSDPSAGLRSSPPESSESDPNPGSNDESKEKTEPSDGAKDTREDAAAPDAPVQKNNDGKPQAPDQPATSSNEVPKNDASPSNPPADEPEQNPESMSIQTSPNEAMDVQTEMVPPISDPAGDAGAGSTESSDRSAGSYQGLAMVPEQWPSPDGLYRASWRPNIW